MNFNPQEILQLVALAKEFKPVISQATDELLDNYGPELGKVVSRLRTYLVNETHESIQQYQDLGYTKEEAILLTLNTKLSLEEALKNSKRK